MALKDDLDRIAHPDFGKRTAQDSPLRQAVKALLDYWDEQGIPDEDGTLEPLLQQLADAYHAATTD